MSLRFALLGLLMEKDATGYELMIEFKEKIIYFWNAHHTQIYRELGKMEEAGLVKSHVVHQTDYPDKKVYHIEEKGKQILLEWLSDHNVEPPKLKDNQLLKVAMFQFVDPDEAIAFLEKSKTDHEFIYKKMTAWQEEHLSDKSLPRERIGEVLTSEYGIRYMKNWLEWCDWAIKLLEQKREVPDHD